MTSSLLIHAMSLAVSDLRRDKNCSTDGRLVEQVRRVMSEWWLLWSLVAARCTILSWTIACMFPLLERDIRAYRHHVAVAGCILSATVDTATLFPCHAVLQLMASHVYICLDRLLQFSAHLGVISSLRPAQILRYSHLRSRFLISNDLLGKDYITP